MYPIPLVELVETHKGERMVVMTITAGCARSLLRAAKERWRAAGALAEPSAYHPDCTRQTAITIMVDRMRRDTDGKAIQSKYAREVLAELGQDTSRIGRPVNSTPARRVYAGHDHRPR